MSENEIATVIVDSAYRIHRSLGSGLFESVYHQILEHELRIQGLSVESQKLLPVHFGGIVLAEGFRPDLIVESKVIVEIKSIESIGPVHKKQLLTYLRLSGLSLGLLINFGAPTISAGVSRVVNGLIEG